MNLFILQNNLGDGMDQ